MRAWLRSRRSALAARFARLRVIASSSRSSRLAVVAGQLVEGRLPDAVLLVPLVGGAVALVGDAFALVGEPFAFVGRVLALVGDALALVGEPFALVGGDVPLPDVVLALVERLGAGRTLVRLRGLARGGARDRFAVHPPSMRRKSGLVSPPDRVVEGASRTPDRPPEMARFVHGRAARPVHTMWAAGPAGCSSAASDLSSTTGGARRRSVGSPARATGCRRCSPPTRSEEAP
jgi:hypothetical protein